LQGIRTCATNAASVSVSLSVRLSVCLLAYVKKTTPDFLYVSSEPWLGLPLTAIRYIMLLTVMWMTSGFHIMQGIGENQTRHDKFARWRNRGRSLLSPSAFCLNLGRFGGLQRLSDNRRRAH